MADSALQYKTEVGMESAYNDGGSAFTPFPNANTGIPELEIKSFDLPVYGGSLAKQKTYQTAQVWRIPLSFYLKGSGVAGTVPELGKLFRMAGLQETDGASTVTYDVRDTAHESGAIKVNLAGLQYLATGARIENLDIALKGGEKALVTGSAIGLYNAVSAVSYSAPVFADVAVTPATVASMALTINSQTHVIPEFNLNIKNQVEIIPNVNAANNGIQEIALGFREFGGDFLVERDSNNDIEYWTALLASTELATASTGFGSAGNLIDFDFSAMQLTSVKPEFAFNRQYYRVGYQINYSATASNEFRLKFA